MAIRVSASGGRRAPQPQRPVGRPKTQTSALVPAAARAPRPDDALTDAEQSLSADAIETFAKVVGGRDGLITVLSIASDAPEVERVVNTLLDPRYERWSLRRVCTLVGLTVADLFTAYRKALIVRAHIRATHIVADKLPPIVDDVMTRATPQPVVCDLCQGSGLVNPIEPDLPAVVCPRCRGTRVTLTVPDLDRQKVALELGQLLAKGGQSIYVQQHTQVATAGALTREGSGALEQLHQAVGSLLFTPDRYKDVIEIATTPTVSSTTTAPDPPSEP